MLGKGCGPLIHAWEGVWTINTCLGRGVDHYYMLGKAYGPLIHAWEGVHH